MQTATSRDAPHGVRQVEIGPERDGQRIDNALVTLLKGVPKSMIYRLLRTGQVRVNGKRAKPDTRLADGDTLRIPPVRMADKVEGRGPAEGQVSEVAEAVIFEDKHFLVIDKPSGVASHGGSGVSHGRSSCCARRGPKSIWNWCIGWIATPAACWCSPAPAPASPACRRPFALAKSPNNTCV